mmetsp:Transcript_58460/g.136027  ORF Transcript_58460/g.136027 Transcript_58460/m.136027 type:complete len:275 (-) Transcript_58460:241-1065(-)
MGGLALLSVYKALRNGLYNPEDYAAAAGELLVFALLICWFLTYLFNPEIIAKNPLKDRVGYNNLCVGWDTYPARWVAAPLFALIIYLYVQFMILGVLRQNLTEGLTARERHVKYVANSLTGVSYCFASLIFVFDPMLYPLSHSVSFIQLVFFGYFAFAANFYTTDPRFHPEGSHIYLAVFAGTSFLFSVFALTQLLSFDDSTQTRGPVPWFLLALTDYTWFICKALGSYFRPHAPSIKVRYELVSDDDFTVLPEMQRDVPKNQFGSTEGTSGTP